MTEIKKQPLSELDFFKKRLSVMERLAATKQQQINSLLEITEAINHNMPIYAITKIYENILRAHQGVGIVVLIVKDAQQQWKCELQSEKINAIEDFPRLIQCLIQYKSIHKIEDSDCDMLRQFEFVIPVFHKKETIGFSLVGNIKETDGNAQEEKLKFIQTITNIVVVANENKKLFKSQLEKMLMEKEFVLAEEIQRTLIPTQLPNNDRIQADAFYKAHKSIGGDYYDLIPMSDNDYIFCISDVSGKGISAALIMANLQANLRILVTRNYPLAQLIDILNQNVRNITRGEKYFTFFIGLIHLESRKLTYVNCGHTPPLLMNGEHLELLDKGCTILGMFEMLPYIHVGEVSLDKNALILNYTDGLSEATDPEGNLFESDRIENFLRHHAALPVHTFNAKLIEEVKAFKKGTDYDDDLTLLTIRIP
jgi:sigma-B regulation protein RsbU (phosphoserine phosphatase)